MTRDELLGMARAALGGLAAGAEFQLSDLIPKEVWTAAPKGARLSAGMAFRSEMDVEPGVACLGRDAKNHQRYRTTAS
ncbi:DUF1413 domain-containing protein [uncultured Sphingomonas sp.]|uniref:DUF1413 domain-containing protein n=1 Tax=uncultured Sphingomonas sp. TaxID=158754 RepID=UPI0025F0186B|nr:DUF1413 domain-containing protein [uncultured Sphingomonas sp.]